MRGIAATLAFAALAALPASAAADPSASVAIFGARDRDGQTTPRVYAAPYDEFMVWGNSGDVMVQIDDPDGMEDPDLRFAAPVGRVLTPGVYDHAMSWGRRESSRPVLEVGVDHFACETWAGSFEVKEFVLDADGNIARLWIVFANACGGWRAGELRIGVDAGTSSLTPTSSMVRWASVDAGGSSPPARVNFGSRTGTAIASVEVLGADQGAFRILNDHCSGRSLAANTACSVWIGFAPAAAGTRRAVLRATESSGAHTDVPVEGFAFGGVTEFRLDVGNGERYLYTPADSQFDPWPEDLDGDGFIFTAFPRVDPEQDDGWDGFFRAPDGTTVAAGTTYTRAEGAQFWLNRSWRSGICRMNDAGMVRVDALAYWENRSPRELDVSFAGECYQSEYLAPMSGHFRYRAGDTTPLPPWTTETIVPTGTPGTPVEIPFRTLAPAWGPAPRADGHFVPTEPVEPAPPAPGAEQGTADPSATADTPPPPPAPATVAPLPARASTPTCGGRPARLLRGTGHANRIVGTPAAEVIRSAGGRDLVLGRGGTDCVAAGTGDDRVDGGSGSDFLDGGPGRDVIRGGVGRDFIDCGPGRDVVHLTRGDVARRCEIVKR